jgi:hypothetical protein
VIYCTNMVMRVHLLVSVVPNVSLPLVKIFSCVALIGQETALSYLVIHIMAEV